MINTPTLNGDDIKEMVEAKLEEYTNLSALERYAMFMGKAQILEFGLKGLLSRKYGVSTDDMEKWTLGKTKKELKTHGVRSDFIAYLEGVVDHRNSMAHEFLADNTVTQALANFSERKLYGDLFRAIYELEQILIIHDWCEEHNCWQ